MTIILPVTTVGSNTIKGTVIAYMWKEKLGLQEILGQCFIVEYKEMHPNIKAHEVFADIEWVRDQGIDVSVRKST